MHQLDLFPSATEIQCCFVEVSRSSLAVFAGLISHLLPDCSENSLVYFGGEFIGIAPYGNRWTITCHSKQDASFLGSAMIPAHLESIIKRAASGQFPPTLQRPEIENYSWHIPCCNSEAGHFYRRYNSAYDICAHCNNLQRRTA